MGRPSWYYSKSHKSHGERQIPRDFTYLWNLKHNKWTKNREKNSWIQTTNWSWPAVRAFGGLGGKVKRIKIPNRQLQKRHEAEKYCKHSLVNNIVKTTYGARGTTLIGDHFVRYINDWPLRCTPEANIILNVNRNGNKKIKNNKKKFLKSDILPYGY